MLEVPTNTRTLKCTIIDAEKLTEQIKEFEGAKVIQQWGKRNNKDWWQEVNPASSD